MSETTQAPSTDRRPSRGRGITAVILFIIASLLLPIGVLTFWGQQTVTDTDRYVETVAPISADPAIQDAVATVVSTQVTSALNLDAALSGYLPANGQVLVGPLTAALDTLIDRAVRAVLASPRFNQAWLRINEAAQKSLMALLEGNQNGPLQVNTSGQIVLDTTSLYEAVRAELVSSGTAFADKLPATIPAAADKQVVLLQSDQFARAQTAYALTKPLATWLLFVAIALFAIAIALSRRRPRMVLATGIAVLVSAALLKVGLAAGGELVHLVFSSTPFAGAESVFFETLTRFLANAISWLMVIGVALAVGGWLFGSSRPALALRGWASKATGSVTDSVALPAHARRASAGREEPNSQPPTPRPTPMISSQLMASARKRVRVSKKTDSATAKGVDESTSCTTSPPTASPIFSRAAVTSTAMPVASTMRGRRRDRAIAIANRAIAKNSSHVARGLVSE